MTDIIATLSTEKLIAASGTYSLSANQTYIASDGQSVFVLPVGATPSELGSRGVVQKFDLDGNIDNTFTIEYDKAGLDSSTAYRISYCNSRLYVTGYMNNTNQGTAVFTSDGKFEKKLNVQLGIQADSICKIDGQLVIFGSITGNTAKRAMWLNSEGNITKEVFFPGGSGGATPLEIHYIGGGIIISRTKNSGAFLTFNAQTLEQLNSVDLNWPSTSVVYAQTWADDRLITLTSRYEGLMWDSYTLNVGSATSGGPSTSEPTDPTGPTDPSDPNLTPVSITTVTGDNIPTDATVRSYWAETGELISELGGVVEPPSELIVQHASSGSVLSDPIVGELEAKEVGFDKILVHANSDVYKGVNILTLCDRPTQAQPFVFKAKVTYPTASTPAAGTASTAFNVGIAAVPSGGTPLPTSGAAMYGLPSMYMSGSYSVGNFGSVIGATFYKPVGASASNDDWVGYVNRQTKDYWTNNTSLPTDATETDVIVTITPQGNNNYELKVSINGTEDSIVLTNSFLFSDETADIYLYLNFHNYGQSAPWQLTNIEWPAGVSTGATINPQSELIVDYVDNGERNIEPVPGEFEAATVNFNELSVHAKRSIYGGVTVRTLCQPPSPTSPFKFKGTIVYPANSDIAYGASSCVIHVGVVATPKGELPSVHTSAAKYGLPIGKNSMNENASAVGAFFYKPPNGSSGEYLGYLRQSTLNAWSNDTNIPVNQLETPVEITITPIDDFNVTLDVIVNGVTASTIVTAATQPFTFDNEHDCHFFIHMYNLSDPSPWGVKDIEWPVGVNTGATTGGGDTLDAKVIKTYTENGTITNTPIPSQEIVITGSESITCSGTDSTNSGRGSSTLHIPLTDIPETGIVFEADIKWQDNTEQSTYGALGTRIDIGVFTAPTGTIPTVDGGMSGGRAYGPRDGNYPVPDKTSFLGLMIPRPDSLYAGTNASVIYGSSHSGGVSQISFSPSSADQKPNNTNRIKVRIFKETYWTIEYNVDDKPTYSRVVNNGFIFTNDRDSYLVLNFFNRNSEPTTSEKVTLTNIVWPVEANLNTGGEISTIKSYLPTDMRAVYQAFDYEAGKFDVITTDNILEIYSTTPNGGYWGGAYAVLDLAEKQPDKITVSFEHEFTPSSGTQLRIFLAQMPTGENLYTSTSNFYYASPADASANNTNQDVYGVSISRSTDQREIMRKGSDVGTYVDVSIPDTVPNQGPTIAIPTPYKIEFIKIADGYHLKLFLEEQLLVDKTIPHIVSNDPNKDLKLVVNIIKKEYLGSHKLHNFKVDIGGVVSGPGELLVPKYAPYYITAHNKEFTLMGAKSYNELETLDTITLDDPAINGTGDIVGKTIGNVVNGNGNNVRAQLRLYSKTTGKLISNNASGLEGYNADAPSGDVWYGVAIDSANRIDYQTFEANTNPNHTYVIKGSLDFITTINGAAVPINSLIPINSQEAWYLDPAGYVFLRSGTVSINTNSYPDAYSYNGELGLPEEKYVEGIPLYLRVK